MFGTMGFSELMIILVIILIIFGAGRLPQIGEGVGKALKGFKKEVADVPSAMDPNDPQDPPPTGESVGATIAPMTQGSDVPPVTQAGNKPFQPGPEQTPGTAAAMLYQGAGPKPAQQPMKASHVSGSTPSQSNVTVPGPISMEDRLVQPAGLPAPGAANAPNRPQPPAR
jgi:TatA/E family protein of Tat protein translocase